MFSIYKNITNNISLCKKKNLLINIDYSLSEIHREDIIPKNAIGFQIPKEIQEDYNYNPNYESIINPNEIIYPEEYCNITKRMRKFMKNIYLKYKDTNHNIILVTHQSLCKSALKLNKNINNSEIIQNYPLGKCCLILENDTWSFKEI